MKGKIATAALSFVLCLPSAAPAQPKPQTVAKVVCPAMLAPPPELSGWASPTPLPAAQRMADLPKAILVPGHAVVAKFHPVAEVDYRVDPQKADGPAVFGGLYTLGSGPNNRISLALVA